MIVSSYAKLSTDYKFDNVLSFFIPIQVLICTVIVYYRRRLLTFFSKRPGRPSHRGGSSYDLIQGHLLSFIKHLYKCLPEFPLRIKMENNIIIMVHSVLLGLTLVNFHKVKLYIAKLYIENQCQLLVFWYIGYQPANIYNCSLKERAYQFLDNHMSLHSEYWHNYIICMNQESYFLYWSKY